MTVLNVKKKIMKIVTFDSRMNNLHFYSSLIINYDYEPIANCESTCLSCNLSTPIYRAYNEKSDGQKKRTKYTLRLFHEKLNSIPISSKTHGNEQDRSK